MTDDSAGMSNPEARIDQVNQSLALQEGLGPMFIESINFLSNSGFLQEW